MTKISKERKLVVKIRHGSHLYGLNTPESDTDYKAIVLPSQYDILMGLTHFSVTHSSGENKSKNSADDVDYEVFSLHKFLSLAIKGEMVTLDMLHCNESDIVEVGATEVWEYLIDHKRLLYTKNLRAYVAYTQKQAAKYGVKGSRIKAIEDALGVIQFNSGVAGNERKLGTIMDELPINDYSSVFVDEKGNRFYDIVGRKLQDTLTLHSADYTLSKIYDNYGHRAKLASTNEGVDWKAVSHALRAGYQARAIFEDGTFSYPLWETSYLKQVKAGELDYVTQVQPKLEELVDEITILSENSDLPEQVDSEPMYDRMREIHLEVVNGNF